MKKPGAYCDNCDFLFAIIAAQKDVLKIKTSALYKLEKLARKLETKNDNLNKKIRKIQLEKKNIKKQLKRKERKLWKIG